MVLCCAGAFVGGNKATRHHNRNVLGKSWQVSCGQRNFACEAQWSLFLVSMAQPPSPSHQLHIVSGYSLINCFWQPLSLKTNMIPSNSCYWKTCQLIKLIIFFVLCRIHFNWHFSHGLGWVPPFIHLDFIFLKIPFIMDQDKEHITNIIMLHFIL